jgi:two-component system LytT family response regulator
MRVLVVDDEPLAVELSCSLLKAFPDVAVVGVARSGRQALAAIRELRPELVLLDIEMPGMSGFEVVQALQADDHLPVVVFVTAFDKYAVRAFDVNAVDYILKPLDASRLERALLRGKDRLQPLSKGRILGAISDAAGPGARGARTLGEGADSGAETAMDRLPVRQGDSVQLLAFDDIDWVDAAGDYMCVHAAGETHILRCTMKQLSDRLAAGPFARIHRSTLVNLNKVCEITPLTKGECLLHLDEDTQLKVSRNYRSAIQHLLA